MFFMHLEIFTLTIKPLKISTTEAKGADSGLQHFLFAKMWVTLFKCYNQSSSIGLAASMWAELRKLSTQLSP